MNTSDLVTRLLGLVDTHYIFPQRSAAIRARIEDRVATGAYAALEHRALAEAITADLRECADDLHFKLIYRDEAQGERTSLTEETPEEIAEFRRVARFNNYGCAEVKRLAGNVGYWRIDEFYDLIDGSGPTFIAAMRLLCNTDALIVDLRSNSGGDPATVALACSFLFDVEPVLLDTVQGRDPGTAQEWWTVPDLDCDRYLDREVYVLIGGRTFSAGEEFAYDLQSLERATLVGQSTAGAAHLRDQFQIDAHHFVNIPTQRPVNPITKTNWEGRGVAPDVMASVEASFAVAYGMALRSLSCAKTLTQAEKDEVRQALQELADEP